MRLGFWVESTPDSVLLTIGTAMGPVTPQHMSYSEPTKCPGSMGLRLGSVFGGDLRTSELAPVKRGIKQ